MSITRRNFLKGAAFGTATTISAIGLTGCGQPADPSEKNIPDGNLPGILSQEDLDNSRAIADPITSFSSEETFDIVVVGAGTSGLPAILTALEEGATVGVLQKESYPVAQGGSSTGFALDLSTEVGILRFIAKFREICGYRVNDALLRTYAYNSGETIMWMNKNAIEAGYPPYTTINEKVDYEDGSYVVKLTNRFGPKPENNGTLVEHLAPLAEDRGAKFFYNTPAVQLITDNGSVTGVIGETENGEYIRLNANKAVILASGDYQNNESMVEKYSPDLVNFDRKQFNKTGDGHIMAMMAGAHMCPVNHSRQMHDADSGPMGGEPFLALDKNGHRFMNEEISTNYWNQVLRFMEYPAGQFCHIFDSNYAKYVTEWGGSPAEEITLRAYIPGTEVTAEEGGLSTGRMDDLIDTHCADTLEELAEMLEEPVDALIESVKRYNELCSTGEDIDFGKQAKYLKPIDTAPFWGIRRNIRITAICGGIAVNENYQVLNDQNEPIPGLYSVGFGAGDLCGATDWNTYVAGMSCGSCMTSGRVAACHAVTGSTTPSNPVTWEEAKDYYQTMGSNGGLSAATHSTK